MSKSFKKLNDSELISLYGKVVTELKARKIIRTKNVVGDIGERIAIDHYTNTSNLESLSDASISKKAIDAIGEYNNNYAIKSITGKKTGVFHDLPHKDSDKTPKKLFDFLLIVKFSDSYKLMAIYELTWEQFLIHKKWHSTMSAWDISLSKAVKADAKIVYELT